MTITISFIDVAYFLLFSILVVAGVYLITVLWRLNKILKEVQIFLENHRHNIDRSLDAVPDILDNINGTSESINAIGSTISETASAFGKGSAGGAVGYIQIVIEVIELMRHIWRARK
ncbi:hypothetical protein BHU72_06880 [Desulfuribacillus stibiiarsenatis]|uniref:DUF948 domain-containing protein n=1 Tax=Desulfuribacillus stibiiarsenatis TaxID=1390249 RepID=A0A1E5L497_9FIRM|nr:hypothetical protein [Desulfuribacillus stibiiarsenatis]OEH84911.1 hypothetical protein BHU72_06880 [Desulfuribacillus stibiiarsenatis]